MGTWTETRLDELCRLAGNGLSASQIAAEIGGVSRNAVIGAMHRHGIEGRNRSRAPRAISARVADRRRTTAPKPRREYAPPSDALHVALVDLEPHHCRFPLGEVHAPGFAFCGAQRESEKPYCEYHCGIAYT